MFFVYILRTDRNCLYTGYTKNLEKRVAEHKSKKGAKYTRACKTLELVHTEKFKTKSEALKREWEIKKMKKTEKEKLIMLCTARNGIASLSSQ